MKTKTMELSFPIIIEACYLIILYSDVRSMESDTNVTEPDFRILGGNETNISNFPFAISIQKRYLRHFCGGSYIAPRFVLSAAHCMVLKMRRRKWRPLHPRIFIAVAGSSAVKYLYGSTMQIGLIDMVLPHPSYNPRTMQNDIGLYRLEEPFVITRRVSFAPLPNSVRNTFASNQLPLCTVVGWGRLQYGSDIGYGDILRKVQVPLISTGKCIRQIHTIIKGDRQICAGVDKGGLDSCQGDSGGPIICNNVQVGLVSWGIGCGNKNSPGVYTKIDYHLEWMNITMMKNAGRINHLISSFMYIPVIFLIKLVSL